MNWRAIGCGTLAAAVFVLVGLVSIWRAQAPAGCPDRLPYEPAPYVSDGAATDSPTLSGVEEPLVAGGRASFGLAGWPVWVAREDRPTASGAGLPPRIVLECGDGTYQAFRRSEA